MDLSGSELPTLYAVMFQRRGSVVRRCHNIETSLCEVEDITGSQTLATG